MCGYTQAGEEQNGQGWLRIQIKVGTKPYQDCFGQSSVADPVPKLIVLFFPSITSTLNLRSRYWKRPGKPKRKAKKLFSGPTSGS